MFFKKKDKTEPTKSEKLKDYTKKVTSYKEIEENFDGIKDLYNNLANPAKVPDEMPKIKKTFSQVARENNLDQNDIARIYKNFAISFYVSVFFAFLSFCISLYGAFVKYDIMTFIASFAITFVFLANCFRFSFQAFKVKHQKFCSFDDWYNSPDQWIPKL